MNESGSLGVRDATESAEWDLALRTNGYDKSWAVAAATGRGNGAAEGSAATELKFEKAMSRTFASEVKAGAGCTRVHAGGYKRWALFLEGYERTAAQRCIST